MTSPSRNSVDLDGDLCYGIAFRILRDAMRAQDAVQQAFLIAWRELPRLRDPERFGPWLHRLLVNACYEELRRYRRWSTNIRVLAGRRTGWTRPDGLGRRP
jgi:RNA polymerase sigma-70 factor (ECF subfamily)